MLNETTATQEVDKTSKVIATIHPVNPQVSSTPSAKDQLFAKLATAKLSFKRAVKYEASAHQKVRTSLHDMIYVVEFIENSGSDKESLITDLRDQYEALDNKFTKGKTKITHMIASVVGGKIAEHIRNQYARLIKLTVEAGIDSATFLAWFDKMGGKQAILNSTNKKNNEAAAPAESSADISETSETTDSSETREQLVERGRNALENEWLGSVLDVRIKTLEEITEDKIAIAIIKRRPDGSFIIKGFVQDEDTLDSAYAAFAKSAK